MLSIQFLKRACRIEVIMADIRRVNTIDISLNKTHLTMYRRYFVIIIIMLEDQNKFLKTQNYLKKMASVS